MKLEINIEPYQILEEAEKIWRDITRKAEDSCEKEFENLCGEYYLSTIMNGFVAVIWGEMQGDDRCFSIDIRECFKASEPHSSMLTNDLSVEEFEKVFLNRYAHRIVDEFLKRFSPKPVQREFEIKFEITK